jgi:hypothetical protein
MPTSYLEEGDEHGAVEEDLQRRVGALHLDRHLAPVVLRASVDLTQ